MPLITDPDLLADQVTYTGATEVFVNTSAKTIRLTKVLDLSDDGVTLKCLYSFLKEEWKDDPNGKNLAAFPFPMTPITDESFEFGDGWDFYDDATRYLIRTAGWTVKNTSGLVTQKWAGVVGLGTIEANDQLYFQQESGGAPTNVQLTGQVNQAVQILRDDNGNGSYVDGSDFDRRTVFNLFCREYDQLYGKATLSDIGVTAMDSIAYRFPISTGDDLNVQDIDANVSTITPYTAIKIRYFDQAFSRMVDSATPRSYGVVVDVGTHSGVDGSAPGGASVLTTSEGGMSVNAYVAGVLTIHEGTDKGVSFPIVSNTATTITVTGTIAVGSALSFTAQLASPVVATAEQIYTKVQWALRQATDIDETDQTVTGKTASELMRFVGSTLVCGSPAISNPNGGGAGVIIEGFKASDTNRLEFYDAGSTKRTFPYVASLAINFGDNLKNDGSAKYWLYYTYSHRKTGTDIAVTSSSGQTCTLTSVTTSFVEILNGEQFLVSGFTTPANNGMYEATGGGGANSIAVKKADTGDENFTNEIAGPSVNLDMNPYGSTSALIVDDNAGADIAGTVGGAASVSKSFNYDGNVQGGRTAGVDAPITAIGIGLATGQFVKATGTMARSTANSISLVAALERNYQNV
jgi:hypothetical protein